MPQHQAAHLIEKAALKRPTTAGPSSAAKSATHPILALQSLVGNAVVSRMIQRQGDDEEMAAGAEESAEMEDEEA